MKSILNESSLTEYNLHKKIYNCIRLHFVFCAKYRRKIFQMEGAKEVFQEALIKECEKKSITILRFECQDEWVHIYIECPPDISPKNIMTDIKRGTSSALKQQILNKDKHATVWTADGIIADSTSFSTKNIVDFLFDQKKRSGKTEREELSHFAERVADAL